MSEESPKPITAPINHFYQIAVIVLLILVCAGIWVLYARPERIETELSESRKRAALKSDSMQLELKKRDSTIISLNVFKNYVDSQKAYISQLEHTLAIKISNTKEVHQKYEAEKKAVAGKDVNDLVNRLKAEINK